MHPEPLARGRAVARGQCGHEACALNPVRGLNGLRCVLGPSSGSKLAVCSARLPQHGAQLCHQDLQALWLAGSRLDVPAAQADEAHLCFAAPANELGHVARGPGGLVAA